MEIRVTTQAIPCEICGEVALEQAFLGVIPRPPSVNYIPQIVHIHSTSTGAVTMGPLEGAVPQIRAYTTLKNKRI